MLSNNVMFLVATLIACITTSAFVESSKTKSLLRSQKSTKSAVSASCQASSLTDLLQCASSTANVPFCLGRCDSQDADDHMDGTFTASSAIDGGASNQLSVAASLDVVNINQFVGATLPLPEKVQKMTQVILGPVGEVGIQNVAASIAGQAGVSATAYSVSMSLSGEPYFGDKDLCPTPLSLFGCAFQALQQAKGWKLTLDSIFEGGAFENTITINTPPVGDMIDSSGNGLSFFLVMETEPPFDELSFEVGITFGVKVAVGNKENPRDIIFEGSLSKPIADTSLGGSLSMVGAWVNVMNMPFFHLSNAMVGAYVEPGIPPVVTEFEIGAQMCFGSRQACGFGAVADGSSGNKGRKKKTGVVVDEEDSLVEVSSEVSGGRRRRGGGRRRRRKRNRSKGKGGIKNKHGICLDASQRKKRGGKVHMWTCNSDNKNQQWVHDASTGQIKNKHGICLDASQRKKRGGKVHMWTCNTNNKNQQWLYNDSTGQIKSKYGVCLDASQRKKRGGKVHMWTCNTNNKNQQFKIDTIAKKVLTKAEEESAKRLAREAAIAAKVAEETAKKVAKAEEESAKSLAREVAIAEKFGTPESTIVNYEEPSGNFIKGLVHMYYVIPTEEDDFAPSDDNFFVMMLSEMSLKKVLGIMGDISPDLAGLAKGIPDALLESGIYPIPNPAIDCSAVGTSTDITTSPPECFARVSFSPLPGNSVGSYTVPEGMAIAGRIQFLGQYMDIDCAFSMSKFKIDASMSPLVMNGGLFVLTRSKENTEQGPKFLVHLEVPSTAKVEIHGYLKIAPLMIEAEAQVSMRATRASIHISTILYGLFPAVIDAEWSVSGSPFAKFSAVVSNGIEAFIVQIGENIQLRIKAALLVIEQFTQLSEKIQKSMNNACSELNLPCNAVLKKGIESAAKTVLNPIKSVIKSFKEMAQKVIQNILDSFGDMPFNLLEMRFAGELSTKNVEVSLGLTGVAFGNSFEWDMVFDIDSFIADVFQKLMDETPIGKLAENIAAELTKATKAVDEGFAKAKDAGQKIIDDAERVARQAEEHSKRVAKAAEEHSKRVAKAAEEHSKRVRAAAQKAAKAAKKIVSFGGGGGRRRRKRL